MLQRDKHLLPPLFQLRAMSCECVIISPYIVFRWLLHARLRLASSLIDAYLPLILALRVYYHFMSYMPASCIFHTSSPFSLLRYAIS